MKRLFAATCLLLLFAAAVTTLTNSAAPDPAHWPQWRGPLFNGMARGSAPVEFSDSKNIKWKIPIAGRGFSTPIIWGDRLFLTTAVPTGKKVAVDAGATNVTASQPRSPNGGAGVGEEQQFNVLCLDRKTGKTLWERTAKIAVPHEGYHRTYGSFASNSPVTDGRFLYVCESGVERQTNS